ncbi:2774_t:CDS:2, partial [Funneliformis caledonium]
LEEMIEEKKPTIIEVSEESKNVGVEIDDLNPEETEVDDYNLSTEIFDICHKEHPISHLPYYSSNPSF